MNPQLGHISNCANMALIPPMGLVQPIGSVIALLRSHFWGSVSIPSRSTFEGPEQSKESGSVNDLVALARNAPPYLLLGSGDEFRGREMVHVRMPAIGEPAGVGQVPIHSVDLVGGVFMRILDYKPVGSPKFGGTSSELLRGHCEGALRFRALMGEPSVAAASTEES